MSEQKSADFEALRRRVDRSIAREVITLMVLALSLLGLVLWVVL